MNDETLVALRNLARAQSLAAAALNEESDAFNRYEEAKRDRDDCDRAHRQAQNALEDALIADRGLLAEAVLGAGTGDNLPLRDVGPVFPSLQTHEPDHDWTAEHMAKAASMTCAVGWPQQDCRKPPGHGDRHTWEVSPDELAEAEQARSSEATATLVRDAEANIRHALGRGLQDGDPLTVHHHRFVPGLHGRCEVSVSEEGAPFLLCAQDPNAAVHLLYAGDGNTKVDYTPDPKGTV